MEIVYLLVWFIKAETSQIVEFVWWQGEKLLRENQVVHKPYEDWDWMRCGSTGTLGRQMEILTRGCGSVIPVWGPQPTPRTALCKLSLGSPGIHCSSSATKQGRTCPWLDAAALSLCLSLDHVRNPDQLVRGERTNVRGIS